MFNDSRVSFAHEMTNSGQWPIKRPTGAQPRHGADSRHPMKITWIAAVHFKSHNVFAGPAWKTHVN